MRRFLAIVLLVLLPLQFSWAAVASYCEHEAQAGAGHFGHHEHEHQADAGSRADMADEPVADKDGPGDKALGAMDLDCGQCHGTCGVMLILPLAFSGALSTSPPCAALNETSGAHTPTRPERPQWLPLA